MPERTRIDYKPSHLPYILAVLILAVYSLLVLAGSLPWWQTCLLLSAGLVVAIYSKTRLQPPVTEIMLKSRQWWVRPIGSGALLPASLKEVVFISRQLLVVDLSLAENRPPLRLYFAGDNTRPADFRSLSRELYRCRYAPPSS